MHCKLTLVTNFDVSEFGIAGYEPIFFSHVNTKAF